MLSIRESLQIQIQTYQKRKNGKRYPIHTVISKISDITDFKSKEVSRNKEGYHIVMKTSIQQEDIITNIYVSNDRPSKYRKDKWTERKGETGH